MKFNINHKVRIQLTDVGRKAWAEQGNHWNPPDAAGFLTEQLWQIMQTFGPLCDNGAPVPFHTDIEIPTEDHP